MVTQPRIKAGSQTNFMRTARNHVAKLRQILKEKEAGKHQFKMINSYVKPKCFFTTQQMQHQQQQQGRWQHQQQQQAQLP